MLIHEGKTITINVGAVKQVFVEDVLGTGGFANVYKVKDTATSKYYVLKHIVIKPTVKSDEKEILIKRIKVEGEISIPSEYIVQPIGLNEFDKDNFAILFEFIPNTKGFDDWILDNKGIDWETKKQIFIQILKGVHDAHSMNVFHRDLKPQNILITKENTAKIIDFGLAKCKDMSITKSGDIAGTYPYLDPKALLNGIKFIDARADIYALGVILHQLVIGTHFWVVNDNMDFPQFVKILMTGTVNNILDIDLVKKNFTGSEQLKNVITQSTMFDPEKRINNANEMIKLLGEEPVEKIYPKVDYDSTVPYLIVEDGSAKGSHYPLVIPESGERQLGRLNLDATNDSISRKHAKIYREGNQYYLFDTESRNGTFFNGSKIGIGKSNKVEINHTDRIRFADLWTRFVFLKK